MINMKICYISYVKYGAGSCVHTSQFITALRAIHDDLIVYTPLARPPSKQKKSDPFGRIDNILNNFREIRLIVVMFTRRAIGEIRLLRSTKPDVVILRQARYLSAIPLCRLMNIPIVVEINGPFLENRFSPKDRQLRGHAFWQWLERKMMKLPDHIMVVSEALKQYYVECGVQSHRMTSVPNGVDIQNFKPDMSGDRIRRKFGLEGKTVIGFSGNFAPWHGVSFLADAMREIDKSTEHKDLALLLIGKPGELLTMPDFPDHMTTTTGHIPHDQMPEYLAAVDIFVAPYPTIEPFYFSPLKIFEAMAMGKPVIASAQGQICELIIHGVSGLLYSADNQSEFIENLDLLVKDTSMRRTLGRNARKTMVNNFTWKENAHRMLSLCKQVVESKNGKNSDEY